LSLEKKGIFPKTNLGSSQKPKKWGKSPKFLEMGKRNLKGIKIKSSPKKGPKKIWKETFKKGFPKGSQGVKNFKPKKERGINNP